MITFTAFNHEFNFADISEIDAEMEALISGYNAILFADPNCQIAGYRSAIVEAAYSRMIEFHNAAYVACGYAY
jgi:hypothetical protein